MLSLAVLILIAHPRHVSPGCTGNIVVYNELETGWDLVSPAEYMPKDPPAAWLRTKANNTPADAAYRAVLENVSRESLRESNRGP
jgi:hypothetical protein